MKCVRTPLGTMTDVWGLRGYSASRHKHDAAAADALSSTQLSSRSVWDRGQFATFRLQTVQVVEHLREGSSWTAVLEGVECFRMVYQSLPTLKTGNEPGSTLPKGRNKN